MKIVAAFLLGQAFAIVFFKPESGKSFDDAFQSCTHMPDGRLAIVTEDHVAQAIYNNLFVPSGTITSPLIGLRQMDTSSEPAEGWMWRDVGRQAPINKSTILWKTGEPDNKYGGSTGGKDCGFFPANVGIEDGHCTGGLGYLCQYPEPVKKRLFKSFLRNYKANNESYNLNAVNDVPSSTKCGALCSKQPTTRCMSYAYSNVDKTCELYWLPAIAMNIEFAQDYVLWETIFA